MIPSGWPLRRDATNSQALPSQGIPRSSRHEVVELCACCRSFYRPSNGDVARACRIGVVQRLFGPQAEPATTNIGAAKGGSILPVRALNVEDGQPAIYGIRPEHITIGDGGLPVRVSVLEPTGAETQIFAKADDDLIDAVIKERLFLKPGDEVPFLIDPANTHIFDRKTSQRL